MLWAVWWTKEVGRRIRQFRQDAGLSQEALAELVGVSFQQVQKYESGHTTLNILKLQHIAIALKVQVSDFFGTAPVYASNPERQPKHGQSRPLP